MEAAAVVADTRALGAAGHGRGRFNGGIVWSAFVVTWFVHTGRYVLDSAGSLLPSLYAPGCARSAGEHGATRSESSGSSGKFGRELVAKVYTRYAATGLAWRNCGHPAGFCYCAGRI